MLHQFKKETCKRLQSLAASARCTTYQEFYKALLRVEDSKNAPSDNVGDESGSTQRKSTGGSCLLVTGRVNLSNRVATIPDNLVKDLVPAHPVLRVSLMVILTSVLREVRETLVLRI